MLVVLSDLHDPDVGQRLRHAAQKHDVIVLHLEDPAERGSLRAGFFRGIESETGRCSLEEELHDGEITRRSSRN